MKNILLFLTILIVGCAKETDVELWQKVIDSRERKSFDSTILFAQRILKDYPKSDMIMPSTFMLADVYYNNIKNYEKSLFYFKNLQMSILRILKLHIQFIFPDSFIIIIY